jgi:hypothetical protein
MYTVFEERSISLLCTGESTDSEVGGRINTPSVIRALSIDGGTRGIISAMVPGEIEDRTEKPASELFDLIAGTSTGELLALGLAKPAVGSNKSQHENVQSMPRALLSLYVAL